MRKPEHVHQDVHYFIFRIIIDKDCVKNFTQINRYPTKIACHFKSHLCSKY